MHCEIESGSSVVNVSEWRREPARLGTLLTGTDYDSDALDAHVLSDGTHGREVTLMGWVDTRRDLGALIFLWLRDRNIQELNAAIDHARMGTAGPDIAHYEAAVVQVTFNPELAPDAHKLAETLGREYVIAVKGVWRKRSERDVNPRFLGGDRELVATELRIINPAETPPFYIADDAGASEDLRMQYRYLDLRRKPLVDAMVARHKIFLAIRNALDKLGFLEIETPMLGRSTPEGARDYLVPARNHPGKFYALPQSPQLYKQLLMVGGMDKYFQMARCFRDEDLRANRQPEFTQLDLEMSFATRDELFEVGEKMFVEVFRETLGSEVPTVEYDPASAPGKLGFPRMTYDESMARYGVDKPDMRYGCEIIDLTPVFKDSEFVVFKNAIANGGAVKGIFVPDYAPSRKDIDTLTEHAKKLGAGGLAWARVTDGGIEKTSFDKFLTNAEKDELAGAASPQTDGIFLLVADSPVRKVEKVLGNLRVKLGSELKLAEKAGNASEWKFCWIVDFPLYDENPDTGALEPAHHPFTTPHEEFLEKYAEGRFRLKATTDAERLAIRADNYDLVLNGEELGSGSLRIVDPILQRSVLAGIGMSELEIEEQFGFFLNAFKYGAPPHRGFALGMDRIVGMMLGGASIRDVIAFPKTATGSDLMTKAPSEVSARQLEELGIMSKTQS